MGSDHILDDFDFEEGDFDHEAGDSVVVAKYYSPMEAEVAAARLRSEGIPCFLANSASQSVLTSTMVMVRLHVRSADYDRARDILQETFPQQEAESGGVLKGLLIIFGIFLGVGLIGLLFKML
jgi:hypothetical protein